MERGSGIADKKDGKGYILHALSDSSTMSRGLLTIILVSILPFIFIFSNLSFFYTQDGWTHLARGGAFYKAMLDGQIPVRWVGDLNYGYGMPLFNFVFQFPYMVMSLFIFLGFGLVASLKVTTLISFVFSGICMFLFAREFFKDEKKALVVAVFYQFFPFRLVEMFVRGSIGEMYAFTFLPLVLYGAALFINISSLRALIFIALGTAGMLLSHLATGAVFLGIAGIFIVLFAEKIKKIVLAVCAMILGLGLSSYYWIPAFADHKYTYGSLFAKDLYAANFVPFFNFFIPNFLNIPELRMGDVPISVGLFHTVAIVIALVLLLVVRKIKNVDKKIIIFCVSIIVGAFFIMQPVSQFIWANVPLFEQFQFPWRFLGSVGFATSLLAVYFLRIPLFKKKIFITGLLILVVGTTAWYWYPQLGFRTIKESDYWNYPLDTTYFGETNLIWSAGGATAFPKERVEVIGGEAFITDIQKKSNRHTYTIDSKGESRIIDHTQFFPGWKVFVDGQSVPIQFQDPSHRGEITYAVPDGKHSIQVIFGETKLRMIANLITIISFIFVGLLLVLKRFNIKFLKKVAL
jgi:hypothetical protein